MRVGKAAGGDWLRLGEAADALGVSLTTLRRWSDAGKLTCYRSPGGHRRYRRADVESMLGSQAGHDDVGALTRLGPATSRCDPLHTLAQVAAQGADVPFCRYLVDVGGEGLRVAAASSGLDAARERWVDPQYDWVALEVFRTGRRAVIADLGSTILVPPHAVEAYRRCGDSALLAVPMVVGEQVIGVLELCETRRSRSFTGDAVAFAEFMARQGAILAASEEGIRHLSMVPPLSPEAAAAVGASSAEAEPSRSHPGNRRGMLAQLLEGLRGGLGALACDVSRYDETSGRLTVVASSSTRASEPRPGREYAASASPGLAAFLANGPPRLVTALDGDQDGAVRNHKRRADVGHVLWASIRLGGRTVGLLEIYTASEPRFDPMGVALIDAAAILAGLFLAEPSSDQGTPHLSLLSGLVETVGSGHPASQTSALTRSLLDTFALRHEGASCILYQLWNEALSPTSWAPSGSGLRPGPAALGDVPAAARAVTTRGTVVAAAGAGSDERTSRYLAARDITGAVFRPLVSSGQVVALLEVGSALERDLATWSPAADVLAHALTLVIGSGRALDCLQQRNRDLEAVIEAGIEDAARLDADQVLPVVAQKLSELTNAPVAEIYRVDGDLLRTVVCFDGGRLVAERAGTVIPLLRSPCSRRAVETRRPFVVAGTEDPSLGPEERYLLEKWGYQSQFSVPLLSGGTVVGLVELSDYVSREFGSDLDLVLGLGQVAANALSRAALLDQAERRNRILNELVDLGALASRAHDLDELLSRMAERLLVAVDAADCDIFRGGEDGLLCVASFDRSGHDDQLVGRALDAASYPTLFAAAIAHRSLVIDGWDDPKLTERERRLYREYGFASEVSIPLVAGGRLYGLIDLYDTRERDYSEYMSFLRSVSQTLAAAIESSLLFEQVEQRGEVLREIVELGVLTSQTRDPQELLRVIAARLRDTTQAADCDIFTLQGGRLRCLVSADERGFDEEVVGDVLDIDGFPATAMAVHSGEPMVIPSLEDPRLTDYERENYAAYGYQSELCIPLLTGEKVIGLIDIFDVRPRDYSMFIDYLRSVGQMAAGAIENALLVEELERRNAALAELVELGRAASGAGDLEGLARSVGPRLVQLVGAAGCQIFALQDERLRCILTYEDGNCDDDYVGRPLDLDLFPSTREALDRRAVLVISSPEDERLSDHERRLYHESGSASEICVPMAVEDRVVGLLEVYDHRPRDYAEYRDFLVSAAQTLAGVVENALLMERLEETNAMLNLLVESGLEFGETLELEPILQSVARRLCAVTDAPACDIYTVEEDGLRCVACIEKGVPDDSFVGSLHSFDEFPLARDAVDVREPLLVTDIAVDDRQSARERDEDLRSGHRAKLELPLVSRGNVVGVAAVFDDHPREFADLDLLQSLAQVAANALANATLFERLDRTAERMALVTDVSYDLSSSLELDDVLRSTALRLCSVAGTPACDIYTLKGDRLVNVVCLKDGRIDTDRQGRESPLAERPILGRTVASRSPVNVVSLDDPGRDIHGHTSSEAPGATSRLAVPLICKDRVIGVLELVDTKRQRTFSPEEMDTVSAVCRVAALAIDNANLVEDLQLRNRENELLNEIAGATSVSLNLPDIAAAAMERLRQIVPFDRGLVALRRDEQLFDVAYVTDPRPAALPDVVSAPRDGLLHRLRDEKVVVLDLASRQPCGFELPGDEAFRSQALVALAKGSELIGVLSLGARAPRAFGSTDSHLLERTGTHLALAIDNARMYGDIKHMHLGNLKALSSALNAKDYYTLGHAARVAAYMVLLGQELGWPVDLLGQVEEAAYLHDIGKIGVSDRVLLKPSGLTGREWELMRQHPIFSADIIRSLFPEELVLGVRHHHERFEGGGYPDGLSGAAIPLIARAMCVADSYDAMSFRRPYRHGLTYHECIEELRRCSGTQFDPAMVDTFLRVLERLADGRREARRVALEAAARVDPEDHALLRSPEDEARPEYRRILEAFRDVCAQNPPTRFITSHVRLGKKTAVVVDSGQAGPAKPHIGDEMMTDDELVEVFAGRELDANVLLVDQWGVWVSGTAPVLDRDGGVVAAVTADIPATDDRAEFESLRSSVAQTFASMLHTAAVHAGRSEIEAITDGLTGLYNHRYFHERLSEEIDRCLATDGRVSLLFCDLDNFRVFNEKHGHSAGDQALRAVARVIESSVRHVDIAARFGGEEFAAILMDTDEQGALEVAERIRAGILTARLAATTSLSISIGVASCPQDAMFKEELIDKADWAMYLAKRQGRDQVMSFSARHGSDTPEQAASVGSSYVAAMSDLVAARDAYERRRRYAIAHLAQAVGADLGLDAGDLRAMAAASETDTPHGVSPAGRVVLDVAAAYQALVAERPYREQLSEAEALEELLGCTALVGDQRLAAAFERVLSGAAKRS